MTWKAAVRLPWRLVRVGLLMAALAVPVYFFVRLHASPVPMQVDPPRVSLAASSLAMVPPYDGALPVLVYHDISSRPGRQTVQPRRFAEQMAALQLAGFHTVSAAQTLAFLRGRSTLPQRPVMIAFDNGLGSAWRVADPILAQHGFRAISFINDERVGRAGYYYLRAGELEAMMRSGRWELEAQVDLAGPPGTVEASGSPGATLVLPADLRNRDGAGPRAEFAAHASAGLERTITGLRDLGADPLIAGYSVAPSSLPGEDPNALETEVARRFAVSFAASNSPRFLDAYDRGAVQPLPSMALERGTTAPEMIGRLAALAPIAPRVDGAIAAGQPWMSESGGNSREAPAIRGGVLTLAAPPRHWEATFWAPGRSELWRDYKASVTVEGLGSEGSGTSATLLIGGEGSARYAVTVSAGRLVVSEVSRPGAPQLAQARIAHASQHDISASIVGGHLRIEVGGRTVSEVPTSPATHGGIGLGAWRAGPRSPTPAFTSLSVEPAS
jgi:hypothetical protein